ncbi:hypothetical protein BJ742DRAFT_769709 [Cladochytrium replicatum]|nr:hypothetical protein BJ742DRAFT_769709 [Cladochytrium replicatum]
MTPEDLEHVLEQGPQAAQLAVTASADPEGLAIGIGGSVLATPELQHACWSPKAGEVTGSGTGAKSDRLRYTRLLLSRLAKYPDLEFKDVLRRISGLEIAMVGAIRAAMLEHRVPVLVDGIVTLAACLFALRISRAEGASRTNLIKATDLQLLSGVLRRRTLSISSLLRMVSQSLGMVGSFEGEAHVPIWEASGRRVSRP